MAITRRTLMVTEKPSQMRNIAPHWQDRFPHDKLTHFHTPPIGSFGLRLPRDLPLSSVPIVADPVLERRPSWKREPEGPSPFDGDFGALARDADHIVCATDHDPAGCRNFLDLIVQYAVETPLSDITWLAIRAEHAMAVRACIDRGLKADHPSFAQMAAIGQARRYFDNLYLLNALPVFGLALKAVGIAPVGRFALLSKYTLQLLLLLSRIEKGPLRHGEIVGLMIGDPAPKGYSPLGSAKSREAIVSWLQDSGCLEAHAHIQDGIVRYSVSERGQRLVRLLHKDCFDPHLSARLQGWGKSWPASKPAIERYIRTFFGKQKRHLLARV